MVRATRLWLLSFSLIRKANPLADNDGEKVKTVAHVYVRLTKRKSARMEIWFLCPGRSRREDPRTLVRVCIRAMLTFPCAMRFDVSDHRHYTLPTSTTPTTPAPSGSLGSVVMCAITWCPCMRGGKLNHSVRGPVRQRHPTREGQLGVAVASPVEPIIDAF